MQLILCSTEKQYVGFCDFGLSLKFSDNFLFRTILIFIQSYIFNFCMLFSLLVSVLFFHKSFLQVYIQEAGEGTSPVLSFLHPFVMFWNKKLSAESDIGYIDSKRDTE